MFCCVSFTNVFLLTILYDKNIQSTLVISNPNGLSETLRDIHASKYQSCRSEESNKSNNHIKHLTPEDRDILKILWKRGEIAP